MTVRRDGKFMRRDRCGSAAAVHVGDPERDRAEPRASGHKQPCVGFVQELRQKAALTVKVQLLPEGTRVGGFGYH